MPLDIRRATSEDDDVLWRILEPTIRAGETYALDQDMSREAALSFWTGGDRTAYVAEEDGKVVGTYSMRTNQAGGGSHVANCGYVVHPSATGGGIARAMGEHSIATARELGYRAIQFNFVVSTNTRAVRLWQSLGFEIVGQLPAAFKHPTFGFVDVYVMYLRL